MLAKGSEEGQEIRLTSRRFALTVGEPVRFNLLTSTHDHVTQEQRVQNGALFTIDTDKFQPLPPYIVTLPALDPTELAANQKQRVEVQLACQLTEVGTLQIVCVNPNDEKQRWQVEFDIRHSLTQAGELEDSVATSPKLQQAKDLISKIYSANKTSADQQAIKTLTKELEKRLGKRETWDFSTLRSLFDTLALGRKRVAVQSPMKKTGYVWPGSAYVPVLVMPLMVGGLNKFGRCTNKVFSLPIRKVGQIGGYSGVVLRVV